MASDPVTLPCSPYIAKRYVTLAEAERCERVRKAHDERGRLIGTAETYAVLTRTRGHIIIDELTFGMSQSEAERAASLDPEACGIVRLAMVSDEEDVEKLRLNRPLTEQERADAYDTARDMREAAE